MINKTRPIQMARFSFSIFFGIIWATASWGVEPTRDLSPAGLASPGLSAVPTVTPLSEKDQKILLNQFISAQKTAILALDHRHRFELKALKESQRLQAKEWEKKERELRHQFFAANAQGAIRRDYIHSFIQRREEFYRAQSSEKKRVMQEQEQKLKAVHQEHSLQFQEFNRVLKQGQKPGVELWPRE